MPGTFVQLNPQISVQTGGNPDLTPETSDTYTIGLGYSPSWAENASWIEELTFDVNYYNIKLENAIQALDAQVQLDNCVETLSPTFCDGIVRAAGGSIIAFANQLTNIGRIETEGFDWTFTLTTPEFGFGALRFTWANTYLAGYKEFTLGDDGLVERELAGIELGSPIRGYVRYKSTLATDWQLGDFVTSLTLRYLSAIDGDCTAAARRPGAVQRSGARRRRAGGEGVRGPAGRVDADVLGSAGAAGAGHQQHPRRGSAAVPRVRPEQLRRNVVSSAGPLHPRPRRDQVLMQRFTATT